MRRARRGGRVIELITTRGTDYFINEILVEALPRGTMRGSPGCFCYLITKRGSAILEAAS